jgi:hypothetical protein
MGHGYLKYWLDLSKYTIDYIEENPNQNIPYFKIAGRHRYNSDYLKLLKQEAGQRMELMIKIMKSRGIDYTYR